MVSHPFHAFLLIFWGVWGRSLLENFGGLSGYFSTFLYLWNYFLLFFKGSGGDASEKFWNFLTRGATENFSSPFPDFLLSENKNRWDGVRSFFFPDVIFFFFFPAPKRLRFKRCESLSHLKKHLINGMMFFWNYEVSLFCRNTEEKRKKKILKYFFIKSLK